MNPWQKINLITVKMSPFMSLPKAVNNGKKDIDEDDEEILQHMVRNNILYFDPTEAVYYPQGKSYHHGIKLYFAEK